MEVLEELLTTEIFQIAKQYNALKLGMFLQTWEISAAFCNDAVYAFENAVKKK
jgi:hypothetical protein